METASKLFWVRTGNNVTDQASEPGLIQRNTLSYTAHYDGKKTGRRYRELVFSTQVCYRAIVRPQEKLLPSSGPQFSQRLRSLITSGKVQVHHFVWRNHIFFFLLTLATWTNLRCFSSFQNLSPLHVRAWTPLGLWDLVRDKLSSNGEHVCGDETDFIVLSSSAVHSLINWGII